MSGWVVLIEAIADFVSTMSDVDTVGCTIDEEVPDDPGAVPTKD